MNLVTLFSFLFVYFLYNMKKYNFYVSIIYIHDVYQIYISSYSYMLIAMYREVHKKEFILCKSDMPTKYNQPNYG